MEPGRWNRIAALFRAACEQPREQRSAFLARASDGDEQLRLEVESLLRHDLAADGILERAGRAAAALLSSGQTAPVTIGRYRVIQLIGEGGMGVVYEAEQDHPRRAVALKVLKAGLPSPELLRRFQRESEALGRLQHPGIAQIYEAGSADTPLGPQPYLAMEFIRGVTLLEYAAAHKLSTRQRLKILSEVAESVHHAHQRGIIHRDLKPNNILVDESGQSKILDFGVARMTGGDAETTQTGLGELLGTLPYMSPEQVLGDSLEVDARTDVYALGVILYELLAGRPPYQVGRPIYEAVRAIREENATPLGRVDRAYRGDVETIAAKALEKDKTRRYASAAELATDLRRFLSDEPILARPASAGYQLRKFSTRHKGLVAAVLAILVILVAGALISTWEALRAGRAERAAILQRDRADTEAATAKAVNEFLENDLLAQAGATAQAAIRNSPDQDLKVRTALDRAAARIAGKFAARPAVEASIRATIGRSYFDLGLYPQAEQQLERAMDLQRHTSKPDDADLLQTLQDLGQVYLMEAKYSQADTLFSQAYAAHLRQGGSEAPKTFVAMHDLAELACARGDHTRAEALLTQVLDRQRRRVGEQHPDTLNTMNDLALEYSHLFDNTAAETLYEHALTIMRQVYGNEHPATLLAMNNLGAVYRFRGKYTEAETLLTEVLNARVRILGAQHRDTLHTCNSLALVYAVEGKYPQAETMAARALAGLRRALGDRHPETLDSLETEARISSMEGKLAKAEALYRESLAARIRVLGPEHPASRILLTSLGGLKLEERQYAAAERLLRQALAGIETAGSATWKRFYAASMLGQSLAGSGKYAEAEPLLLTGYRSLLERQATIPAENRAVLGQARGWIAQMYEHWGKPEQAAEWHTPGPTP